MSGEPAFNCSMCGRCCAQRLVLVNAEDVFRLAEYFHMAPERFMQEFDVVLTTTAANRKPRRYLNVRGEKCLFFSAEKGCTVHEVKPLVCRMFPAIKPGITAGEVKQFVREHSLEGGILSCKVFDMPDDAVLTPDRETLVTSVICDSLEAVYYSGDRRSDIRLLHRLMTMADRPDVRKLVSDYLFDGSKESGLAFEHAVFEIGAALQAMDWGKTPIMTPCQGVAFEPGSLFIFVEDAVAAELRDMCAEGGIEGVSVQPGPSIADDRYTFISLAVKSQGPGSVTMAFPAPLDKLKAAAHDGHIRIYFYPASSSMAEACALTAYIDPSVL